MPFEWDLSKAKSNFKKHGVRFSETLPVFEDDYAITIRDDSSETGESRFVSSERAQRAGCSSWCIAIEKR